MAARKLANKIVVTLNGTALGTLRKVGAPAKARDEVDVTCIGDAIEQFLDSEVQKAGELKLDMVWQPGDTNSELLDTLFDDADQPDRVGVWVIQYRMFAVIKFDTFSGYILNLTPPEVGPKDTITRTVTIRLTTAIVRTTGA